MCGARGTVVGVTVQYIQKCVQGLIFAIGGENIDTVEFFDGDKWTLGPSLPVKIQYVQVVQNI